MQEPYSQSQYEDPAHHDQTTARIDQAWMIHLQKEAVEVFDKTKHTPAELSKQLQEALTMVYLTTSPVVTEFTRATVRKMAVERMEALGYVLKGIL